MASLQEVDPQSRVAIIVSHNSRIQCILQKIVTHTETRLKNCCILKMEVNKINGVNIEMIYEGSVSKKDAASSKTYFDIGSFNAIFNVQHGTGIKNLKIDTIDDTYTFYIIRHGQSTHNERTNYGLTLDTSLSDTSTDTAECKQYLDKNTELLLMNPVKYSKTHYSKAEHYFVSDLKRSRQTMNVLFPYKDHIILPCSSEVTANNGNGNCDGGISMSGNENYPSCNIQSIKAKHTDCIGKWDHYLKFYGGKMRHTHNVYRKHCTDTTMIAEAIKIMSNNHIESPSSRYYTSRTGLHLRDRMTRHNDSDFAPKAPSTSRFNVRGKVRNMMTQKAAAEPVRSQDKKSSSPEATTEDYPEDPIYAQPTHKQLGRVLDGALPSTPSVTGLHIRKRFLPSPGSTGGTRRRKKKHAKTKKYKR